MNETPFAYYFDCYKCKHNTERHRYGICCEILVSGKRGIFKAESGSMICKEEQREDEN